MPGCVGLTVQPVPFISMRKGVVCVCAWVRVQAGVCSRIRLENRVFETQHSESEAGGTRHSRPRDGAGGGVEINRGRDPASTTCAVLCCQSIATTTTATK